MSAGLGEQGLLGKEVSETVHTNSVSSKVMRNFRISKALRYPEVKQKTKTTSLMWLDNTQMYLCSFP